MMTRPSGYHYAYLFVRNFPNCFFMVSLLKKPALFQYVFPVSFSNSVSECSTAQVVSVF